MRTHDIMTGVLIDETALTLEELACACAVEPTWVIQRVEAGLLGNVVTVQSEWRFTSVELVRARRLAALERDFDANEELAALVSDLIEEVQSLRAQLGAR
jgi:chaperone modulatory protein CbpM